VPDVRVAVADQGISVRELIRGAVAAQLAELAAGRERLDSRRALARQYLTDAEVAAMAREGTVRFAPRQPGPVPDPEAEADRAVAAFRRGVFAVFAGGRQLTGLDDVVRADCAERVLFLRLTPLVGG
jgi:hypothetical protein